MLRRLRTHRSSTERVPLPHPLPWTVLGVVLVALGAGVAAPGLLGLDTIIATDRARRLVSGQAGDVLGTAIAVAGLLALRHAALSRLARRPGPVEITLVPPTGAPPGGEPQSTGGGGAGPESDGVLADFRRALIEMSLTTPHSVPNSPQDDGFLDDVTTIADKQGNWLATAAGLLKALLAVRYAYRVSVQVRHGAGPGRCGLTIHMVARPGSRGIIDNVWADDWGRAAERAAHRVGAFIVVRSQLSRRGPWSGWHGSEMPADLFHYSQLGRRCLAENRFEEALGHFHDALKLDPLNPFLRIQLAQTQEQVGLYLDALAGYADIIAIESWFDRRLWTRLRRLLDDDPTDQPPARLGTRPVHGRHALLVARYRLVARLTSASKLSRTWVQSIDEERHPGRADNARRARERIALRHRVTVWLKPYYQLYTTSLAMTPPVPSFTQFSANERRLRHFLHFVGCAEVMHLIDDYRWTAGRRRPGMPVTQTALQVMRVWAPLHLQLAELDVDPDDWAACGRPHCTTKPWPPEPDEVDRQLGRVLRRKPVWLREWQEHYNAACAMAVTLTPLRTERRPSGSRRRERSLRAVRHLERAVSATDSRSVGSYAQWLATGDEDLRFLRPTPAFVDFLDRHLPNPAHRVGRPDNLVSLVMSLHSLNLVQRYCGIRISVLGEAGTAANAELEREDAVRDIVGSFLKQDQDWASRLALIEEGRSFCSRHGLPIFDSRLPSFQDDPAARIFVAQGRALVEGHYREIVEFRRGRRAALVAALPGSVLHSLQVPPELRRTYVQAEWRRLGRVVDASFVPPVPAHRG